MRHLLLVFVCTLLPFQLHATDWKTRDTDQPLARAELESHIVGQTLVFFDDGQSVYSDNGEYSYTYGGGGTWLGYYELQEDGVVCVMFVTGRKRCDLFVQAGNRLVLITEDGMRFPIR